MEYFLKYLFYSILYDFAVDDFLQSVLGNVRYSFQSLEVGAVFVEFSYDLVPRSNVNAGFLDHICMLDPQSFADELLNIIILKSIILIHEHEFRAVVNKCYEIFTVGYCRQNILVYGSVKAFFVNHQQIFFVARERKRVVSFALFHCVLEYVAADVHNVLLVLDGAAVVAALEQ